MHTRDFDFQLPQELIAQHPAPKRDQSRLLVWNRKTSTLQHQHFTDLPSHLQPGDLLVPNDSRVIPARLHGLNPQTNGQFELLLLEENNPNDWWAMIRPGKRARPGTQITVKDLHNNPTPIVATVTDINPEGHRRLVFTGTLNLLNNLPSVGELPLPPYIHRDQPSEEDKTRYQTVYANTAGSVAAPTAGLHFTETLLSHLKENGIIIAPVTLHVGPGTFAPVKSGSLADHVMHRERYSISPDTASKVNEARSSGRRVIAIGTTSLRVLESAAQDGSIHPGSASTQLFVHPPYSFQIVDALLTNFHLPCSTLLMLVSAFFTPDQTEGRTHLLDCYSQAIQKRYRFFSYGDAMFIQ